MAKTAGAPQVGMTVQYFGHEDTPMAALVIMTGATYNPERDFSGTFKPSSATSVSLEITRPRSARKYVRHDVPLVDSEAHAELVAAQADFDSHKAAVDAGTAEDEAASEDAGEAPAYGSRPVVRYWRPIP